MDGSASQDFAMDTGVTSSVEGAPLLPAELPPTRRHLE